MQTNAKTLSKTQSITLLGLMTALVVVLQLLGSFIHLGLFSISLVLVPIVIGATLLGPLAGGWLGLAFGVTVLISGDAAFFMGFNAAGTIITVLVKGVAAGVAAGFVYSALQKWNRWVAILAAALVCPVVNTGVFVAGCFLFFFGDLTAVAAEAGENVFAYIFLVLVGGNFLFEVLFNLVLAPVILRLTEIGEKVFRRSRGLSA